jgi:hypothetical protein
MMDMEIKPCPFCGDIPYIERKPLFRIYGDGTTHGYRGCYEYDIHYHNPDCGCRVNLKGNNTIYHSDEEAKANAIKCWNRRAQRSKNKGNI